MSSYLFFSFPFLLQLWVSKNVLVHYLWSSASIPWCVYAFESTWVFSSSIVAVRRNMQMSCTWTYSLSSFDEESTVPPQPPVPPLPSHIHTLKLRLLLCIIWSLSYLLKLFDTRKCMWLFPLHLDKKVVMVSYNGGHRLFPVIYILHVVPLIKTQAGSRK